MNMISPQTLKKEKKKKRACAKKGVMTTHISHVLRSEQRFKYLYFSTEPEDNFESFLSW